MSVIKVENLSKQYRLGQVGTGSLSHDINRLWHRARGKEDPYLKIGEENNREAKGNSDYVWALKDINFDIEQGDRVGIIGRNGAGKSTLLKILSRTTSPTSGSVKIKGRVASLLEVGTGFHPDLSGRDNIFLNGAILGMSKQDIKSRFDEIVDFAGVERYIDTPVKRYSSGMYVRLAFAVAAHLESDILIVDEVLAVGDAEFQKKCLGKMGEVSKGEGRTILFVSHNMAAVRKLCNNCFLIENGMVSLNEKADVVIDHYLNTESLFKHHLNQHSKRSGNGVVQFQKFEVLDKKSEVSTIILSGDDMTLRFKLAAKKQCNNVDLGFSIHDEEDNMHSVLYSSFQGVTFDVDAGDNIIDFNFKENYLSNRKYTIRGLIKVNNIISDLPEDPIGEIIIEPGNFYKSGSIGHQSSKTTFLLKGKWV